MQRLLTALLMLALAPSAFGFTVLEVADRKGKVTLITIHDGWARGQTQKSDYTYVLADLKTPGAYFIDMGERTVTDASKVFFGGERLYFDMSKVGAGPEVAGRPTTEYVIRDIYDNLCSRTFIWEQPPEPELQQLQGFFSQIRVHPRSIMPGLGILAQGLLSPCARAELDAFGLLAKKGLPAMRINAWGETTFRITEVRKADDTRPCMLALPRTYADSPAPILAMKILNRALWGGREKPPAPLTTECPK
ncbi:MAG: hypothetical protein FNT29_03175 [Halothiobacillaceae bacterium]|nr:MAG: hypothetical protein FNT29_03175 [Halothiobacillaceae bacterium]